jgi:lysozyme
MPATMSQVTIFRASLVRKKTKTSDNQKICGIMRTN